MAHSTRNCSDGLNQLHVSMDSHAKRVAFFVGAIPMVRNACMLRIWGFRNKKKRGRGIGHDTELWLLLLSNNAWISLDSNANDIRISDSGSARACACQTILDVFVCVRPSFASALLTSRVLLAPWILFLLSQHHGRLGICFCCWRVCGWHFCRVQAQHPKCSEDTLPHRVADAGRQCSRPQGFGCCSTYIQTLCTPTHAGRSLLMVARKGEGTDANKCLLHATSEPAKTH